MDATIFLPVGQTPLSACSKPFWILLIFQSLNFDLTLLVNIFHSIMYIIDESPSCSSETDIVYKLYFKCFLKIFSLFFYWQNSHQLFCPSKFLPSSHFFWGVFISYYHPTVHLYLRQAFFSLDKLLPPNLGAVINEFNYTSPSYTI